MTGAVKLRGYEFEETVPWEQLIARQELQAAHRTALETVRRTDAVWLKRSIWEP